MLKVLRNYKSGIYWHILIYINTYMVKLPLYNDLTAVPMKLVGQIKIFRRCCWLTFLWFFKWYYSILLFNNWQSNFFRNFIFACIWVKKAPKIGYFNCFFWTFCRLIFLEAVWEKNYCGNWFPIPNTMYCKFVGPELLPKVLLNDQIAGFLKVLYFKNELRYKIELFYVKNKSIHLGLT